MYVCTYMHEDTQSNDDDDDGDGDNEPLRNGVT